MRFAIFGDIHANLEALQAVLADAKELGCTHHVCIGDIVGYNANPCECVKIIRELGCPVVQGNHDEQAHLTDSHEIFNPLADAAIRWTRDRLSDEDKKWLASLRLVRQVRDFTIVHATLDTPGQWGYVFNQLDAAASFSYQYTNVCFYGHTHAPRAYIRDETVHAVSIEQPLIIEPGKKYFINVGSVGQPRDGDWHSSYCIYHADKGYVEWRRIEYDINTAQDKVVEAGLPQRLADRLALGN